MENSVMIGQQILGNQSQIPPALSLDYSYTRNADAGLLGNPRTQFAQNEREQARLTRNDERARRATIAVSKYFSSARLEELKKQKFTSEGKQERISKALAALYQETAIELPS